MSTNFSFVTLLLIPIFSIAQTSILARITKDKITVGADTRQVGSTYDAYSRLIGKQNYSVCKILREGTIFFATAGADMSGATVIAKKCIQTNRDFQSVCNCFLQDRGNDVWDSLTMLKKRGYPLYKEKAIDFLYTRTMIFSVENHTPKILMVGFKDGNSLYDTVKLDESYYFAPGNVEVPAIFAEGHSEAYDSLIIEKYWVGKKAGDYIKQMILKQAKLTPDIVSDSIDIVEIWADGSVHWLSTAACR